MQIRNNRRIDKYYRKLLNSVNILKEIKTLNLDSIIHYYVNSNSTINLKYSGKKKSPDTHSFFNTCIMPCYPFITHPTKLVPGTNNI